MSMSRPPSKEVTAEQLQSEISELRHKLTEMEETIRAIQDGSIDGFVVGQGTNQRIYTLDGADRPYRLFVERMQQGAATLYADGSIAYSNQQLADLLKVPQSRIVGLVLRDFITKDSIPEFDDLLAKGQIGMSHGELYMRRSDEMVLPVLIAINALPAECGVVAGVLVTDLTTEKLHQELAAAHDALRKSEDALTTKEQQLAHITNHTSVIIAQCSRDLRYIFVNRACAEFLGRPAEQIVGQPLAEVMGQEAFDAIHPYIQRVLGGERVEYEAEVPYARIGIRHMRAGYVPDYNRAGEVCGWIAAITDITDRKQTEEALRESESRLSTFLEQLPIGI